MKIITTKNASEKITEGINILADVVKTTLGAKGKNVIINNGFELPKIINDGVSIAREVELEDEVMNTGATLAKQCAEKTNDEAGDGTTTTIVLLQAFLNEFKKLEIKDVREFRRKINEKVDKVINYIDENKKEVGDGDLYRIAKNSSLDKDIANTVTEVIKKIGKDGVVSIENGNKAGITSDIVLGVKIDDGFISPYMITDKLKLKAEIKNAPILMTKRSITSMNDILPVLENLQAQGRNELVIFTEDITDDILAPLIVNKVKGVFTTIVVKTQNMEDIATVTGATIITPEGGEKFESNMLGLAGRVEVGKHYTIVSDGKVRKEAVEEKIGELKKARENSEDEEDKIKISSSIAKLQNGVATIKIAGENEVQTKEKKLKLEDALNAVKSAMEDGIIEGGGMSLYRMAINLQNEEDESAKFVARVITQPIKQILKNADITSFDDNKLKSEGLNIPLGLNVVTQEYEDFYKTGIIDPAKVVKRSLINAFAMGTSIATAEASVIVKKDKK